MPTVSGISNSSSVGNTVFGPEIIPVKLEIKEFSDKNNVLYVAVALKSIKKDKVVTEGNTDNGVTQAARLSNINITNLLEKNNSEDVNFLKYVPDKMLTQEQFEKKQIIKNILREEVLTSLLKLL